MIQHRTLLASGDRAVALPATARDASVRAVFAKPINVYNGCDTSASMSTSTVRAARTSSR